MLSGVLKPKTPILVPISFCGLGKMEEIRINVHFSHNSYGSTAAVAAVGVLGWGVSECV